MALTLCICHQPLVGHLDKLQKQTGQFMLNTQSYVRTCNFVRAFMDIIHPPIL